MSAYSILTLLGTLGRVGFRALKDKNLTTAQRKARDAGGKPKQDRSDLRRVQENIAKRIADAQKKAEKAGDVVKPSRIGKEMGDTSQARYAVARGPRGSTRDNRGGGRGLNPDKNPVAAARQAGNRVTKGFSVFSEGYNKTELAAKIKKHLDSDETSSVPEINRIIKEGVNPAISSAIIKEAAPVIKESVALSNKNAKSTGRKSGAKDSAERAAAEKKETFGQRFAKERKAAKKRGDELTHVFTYKGKKYSTRNEKEEATRKEKASARTSGKGSRAVTTMDIAPPKGYKESKPKKANRGALVSNQRKGHTDMRKGGLFR